MGLLAGGGWGREPFPRDKGGCLSARPTNPVTVKDRKNLGSIILKAVTQPTFLDLFCGCGGFSLGLERAGFKGLAAIDFNHEAVQVFQANFRKIPHILEKDLTQFSPSDLESLIGTCHIDLIVGGPPCQGFSTARQVDGANHGKRLKIRSASGGQYLTRVQAEARKLGYRVHARIEECVKLGVPEDLPGYFHPKLKLPGRAIPDATLWEAIADLPPLKAGEGDEIREYDIVRRIDKMTPRSSRYLFKVLEVAKAEKLTAHRSRPHSDRDLGDFLKLKEGENSGEAMRRNVEFDFPYVKTTFKDRYTKQHRHCPARPSSHLAKDGLMFIHPTQNPRTFIRLRRLQPELKRNGFSGLAA